MVMHSPAAGELPTLLPGMPVAEEVIGSSISHHATAQLAGGDAVPQIASTSGLDAQVPSESSKRKSHGERERHRDRDRDRERDRDRDKEHAHSGMDPDGDNGGGEAQAQGRRSIDAQHSSLANARVANAGDRAVLANAQKHDIHSIKVLGEGAFGIVDLVKVALPSASGAPAQPLLCVRKKLLKAGENNPNDPAKEVEALAASEHNLLITQMWSSVVGLYDYTLLLEYCPYGTLERLLQEVSARRSRSGSACFDFVMVSLLKQERTQGLAEAEARFYAACTVLGLDAMHAAGYMHRDIKPSNCLIADNRYLKLSDLGLTKYLGPDGKAYSQAGTPCYMAPEIVHGDGKAGYGFPSDMWSVGIMLWEMVAGALPKWSAMSWYWTQLHFPPHFSPALCDLLRGLLQKAPKDRLSAAGVLAHPWMRDGLDLEAVRAQTAPAPHPQELEALLIHAGINEKARR